MKVLGLFSGIGGMELGLERAGMEIGAMCEIDPYCQQVLRKHWPEVPIYDDITTREFQEGESDVITAGFPCQDISRAGKRTGLAGRRSGLFREVVRAIRLVRPKFVLLENVASLLCRGMGEVLGTLAEDGHDAEWDCIHAYQVGFPHARPRVFITAHANGEGKLQPGWGIGNERGWVHDCFQAPAWPLPDDSGNSPIDGFSQSLLGNAVVPQIPEMIGRAIMAFEPEAR